MVIAVVPYGRRYKTKAEVLEAWDKGKDFKLAFGSYFSKRDSHELRIRGIEEVGIMYDSEKNPVWVQVA